MKIWHVLLLIAFANPLAAQDVLYSFEDDEEDWTATESTDEFADPDSILTVVSGVGNTDGENALRVEGKTGGYIRHAQVNLDFDRVESVNEAVEDGLNLEFDWTIVASENPGADRFWVQFAVNHSGGWSQVDLFADESFDNGGWQEWDPAGPEVQTMTASIPLEEFGNNADFNNGYCCGAVLDGFSGTYQIQLSVGGGDNEEGPLRSFYLDNFRLVDPSDVMQILGDFNSDQILDAADIDLLTTAVIDGNGDALFDVDKDGQVDATDRLVWVNEIKNTYLGDANLDGEFNSSDLVRVFQAGEYEDSVANNSTWETGDWNGDQEFSSGDFVAAFQAGGFEQGPRGAVANVPEPANLVSLLCIISMIGLKYRRK